MPVPISRRDRLQPFRVMIIRITKKEKDCFIKIWLYSSHRVKETVTKWTIVPWVSLKGINIKICCPTVNTKHTRLLARTLQLTLPQGAESFPNKTSHSLGTRCGVPQPLLGATKARDTKLWEIAAIRDFRLSTNQNIIIRSSHSQLVLIAMKTTNVRIENQNPLVRTWTRIWLDMATNNQQQTQPIGKIKEIHFSNTHKKRRIDSWTEVHLAELLYQVRLKLITPCSPWPRAAVMVKGICHHL